MRNDSIVESKVYDVFQKVWLSITNNFYLIPQDLPIGYVLGGQPGAGKSVLIQGLVKEHNGNILVINADEFRQYHPDFDSIQSKYGKEAVKYTAEFAAQLAELMIFHTLAAKYHCIVEGTFRTSETPLNTLRQMREQGYQTAVCIQVAPAEISWQSTLQRYDAMQKMGLTPRATPKSHHDLVVSVLGKNADTVFTSGAADSFRVYSREKLLFDNKINKNQLPSYVIQQELDAKT